MRGNLRFALTALTWAVILLAIYAITARAQTRGPLHEAAGVGWAAQAGAPGLPVLKGRTQAIFVNRWTDRNSRLQHIESAFRARTSL